MTEPASETDATPVNRPRIHREVALALALLFGMTFGILAVELVLPSVAGASQALLAVGLLFIPGFVLRKRGLRIDDCGVGFGSFGGTAKATLIALLLVFPIFVGGFHVFQLEFLGADAQWDSGRLARWDQALEYAPTKPCEAAESGPVAWVDRHGLWVISPPGTSLSLEGPTLPDHARRVSCQPSGSAAAGSSLSFKDRDVRSGRHLRGLLLELQGLDSVDFTLKLNGEDLAPATLRTGRYLESAEALEGSQSLWWILTYFIVHLGLVALPEEWFFRGYLQDRLDRAWGTPFSLLGVRFGWGLVGSALAFAALHPILLPGVHRLLVFFPALFFGWLRARTGNIGAAVLVHALSNLLLAIIGRMYGVA